MRADIVIIGGGIVGSSIAYHLAHPGGAGEVLVIERDPSYEQAATPRSNGGIRRLFSLPENIEMACYGLAFYRDFARTMAVGGEPAEIGFRRQGYLFVSDAGGARQMEANFALQQRMGVEVELLAPDALAARFPSLSVEGVDLAVLSDHDAWIDPHAALLGFRRKARALGVRYEAREVAALEADTNGVRAARCSDGRCAPTSSSTPAAPGAPSSRPASGCRCRSSRCRARATTGAARPRSSRCRS